MDYKNIQFKDEIVISPMFDISIGRYVANVNFEALLTDEQYDEFIDMSGATNVNREQDMSVYFDATIPNIYNASMKLDIKAGLIYNDGKEYVKLPDFTQEEKEYIILAMDKYCKETAREGVESSKLVDIVLEAKEAALEEAALDAPNRGFIEENDIFANAIIEPIQEDDLPENAPEMIALNIYFDDNILNELALRTPLFEESEVKSYSELLTQTDITMYAIATYDDAEATPTLLLVRESETLGYTDYNIPLSEEEKAVVKDRLYKYVSDRDLSLDTRFKDMLFAMGFEVKATADLIAENKNIDPLSLEGLCKIVHDDPKTYKSLEDFVAAYPYAVTEIYNPIQDLPIMGGVYDGIRMLAKTAYGISDNFKYNIERYFKTDMLKDIDDVNKYKPDAVRNTIYSDSSFEDILKFGNEIKQGSDEEQSFYRAHEFDFKVIDMLVNHINEVDLQNVAPVHNTLKSDVSDKIIPVKTDEAYKMWLDGFDVYKNENKIVPFERDNFRYVIEGDFIHISLPVSDFSPEIEELQNHLSMNGYNAKWDENKKGFVTTSDEIDFIDTILKDRGFEGYGREDIFVTPAEYSSCVQEKQVVDILLSKDHLLVSQNDYLQYQAIDTIARALDEMNKQGFGKDTMEEYVKMYSNSLNENVQCIFNWNKNADVYTNIENALVDKDIYFIQKIVDEAMVYMPDMVSEATRSKEIYKLPEIKKAILDYRDKYLVEQEPEPQKITITCDFTESAAFEQGKSYSVLEFDSIMLHEDKEKKESFEKCKEKYGNYETWRDAYDKDPQNVPYPSLYEKVKFTINFPDGHTITERQDIGDGYGGVIDFLKSFDSPEYKNAAVQMNNQAYNESIEHQADEYKNSLLEPHTYIHFTETPRLNQCRYEVYSIPTDSTYPNDTSNYRTAEQAHTAAHIQLENALDEHSLAPKDDKIDGYAIFDTKKHIIIETAGNFDISAHFNDKVIKDTLKAEKADNKAFFKNGKKGQEQRD